MEVFGQDMIIGEFCLSDHGLMLASFNYSGDSEDDLGLEHSTEEIYTDNSPIPLFLGTKYSKKLAFDITIIKKCPTEPFTEFETRNVLRYLTGMPYYQWSRIITEEPEELLYYYCRTTSASLQRINGKVVGILLTMECDSPFAWTQEFRFKNSIQANESFYFFNQSDDIYSDFYPLVKITSKNEINELVITNSTYNNYETVIKDIFANETITLDCQNQILSSSITDKQMFIYDRFNFVWPTFIPGKNQMTTNQAIDIEIICRFPRKVGLQI